MDIQGKRIGVVMTGSFCTFSKVINQMKNLVNKGADVIPIMSNHSYTMDTKFGEAKKIIGDVEQITGKKIIKTIQDAEPIGPKKMTDIMLVAPCSGNTLAKLSNGLVDNAATMAIKSHLRNRKSCSCSYINK